MAVAVRRGGAQDVRYLRDMLHHAYYWKERVPGEGPGPVQLYVKAWGRPGDTAVIAIEDRLGVYIAARGTKVQIEGEPDAAARRARVASNPERYLRIDPASSREQYRWMERFVSSVSDQPLRERLLIAIDDAAAEGDDRAAVAADRDHQPVAEAIDGIAVLALHQQARAQQQWL